MAKETMNQETKMVTIWRYIHDDDEIHLKARLGGLSEDENVQLRVSTFHNVKIDQVDKLAKALARWINARWRLVLDLGYSELTSVPESVWELANLEELKIDQSQLKTISPGIVKLAALKKFRFSGNPLGGFPEDVCKLDQLETLHADFCRFSVLPSSFASLHNLLELHLGGNSFKQFPDVICELRNLRELCIHSNKLSSLPQSFANLRELTFLNISNNRFKDFPSVVCELPTLWRLSTWGNRLSELPLAITKLILLQYLHLQMNLFTSIPLFVGDLPQLSFFQFKGWFVQSFLFLVLTIGADNPLQGPQSGLNDDDLLRFLQQRRVIPRLSAIIGGGFFCEESNAWTQFLVRGLYDPRLFIFIFDFAFDFALFDEEKSQKKLRLE